MSVEIINRIQCKDCGVYFFYSDRAAAMDRKIGRTPPERCAACRKKHRREYSILGVSHNDILQIRSDGQGGLAAYNRVRATVERIETQRSEIDPFPIEKVIGAPDEEGTILYGLLHDSRRVHLVIGPTGSGKSTWLPFRLLTCDELIARGPIVITQPRIPATKGPAEFVAKMYYGDKEKNPIGPGMAIGYRYSEIGSSMTDSANQLVFMTDGTLLNMIKTGELRRYSIVMIDEAHERSVNIDKILSLLSYKLEVFPHLQVIIASATVDAETFLNFFGGPDKVAKYEADGFTYPILEIYSNESVTHCPNLWNEQKIHEIWGKIDPDTIAKEMLSHEPCWSAKRVDGYKLRYYPLFESLVLQGLMSAKEKQDYQTFCPNPIWKDAIERLFSHAARQRRISSSASVSIDTSLRGSMPKVVAGKPARVAKDVREKLIWATIDSILMLIERDDEEVKHRHSRWLNKDKYHFPKLGEPLPVGHILAFLPTSDDIRLCTKKLTEILAQKNLLSSNCILQFFREAPNDEKDLATEETRVDPNRPIRKIVIGSNLAETSLTLHGLVYVVDSGIICEEYFEPGTGKQLPTVYHSRAGCRQRIGRVGRKEPGEAYRLYTREELLQQAPFTTPQIARSNAEDVILDLVMSGVPLQKIEKALMNPPTVLELERAKNELLRFSALDVDGDITTAGRELTMAEGDSILSKKLLSEADKFGVLWEMAIFLAMTAIRDCDAPAMQSRKNCPPPTDKWSGLWAPCDQPVYFDADEEDQETAEKTDAHRQHTPALWDNPYILAGTLVKREAMINGCLDDLELYLRIWQGWFSQLTSENRLEWAKKHSVNHFSLQKVEESLGIKPNSEKGAIKTLWAVDEKGELSRDVDFCKLDLVRFLYAAAFPDRIYRRATESSCFFNPHKTSNDRMRICLHHQSVWSLADTQFNRRDERIQKIFCVANPRLIRANNAVYLSHLVWLDPAWVDPTPPSLLLSSIDLTHKFSTITDKSRAAQGQVPFYTGSLKAGFQWPMPDIPCPTQLEIMQWSILYANEIRNGTPVSAKIVYLIDKPEQTAVRIVLVQVISGPLIPLHCDPKDETSYGIGQDITIRLAKDKGLIWGYKIAAPALASKEESLQVVPMNVHTVPTMNKPQPPAMHPQAQEVRLRQGTNALARVEEVIITEKLAGFRAAIFAPVTEAAKVWINYPLLEANLRKEAVAGRIAKIRIIRVAEDEYGGELLGWEDGGKVLDMRDDWPLGTLIAGEITKKMQKEKCYIVRIKHVNGHVYDWPAYCGKAKPEEIKSGRKVLVRITEWKQGNKNPWPCLSFSRWLS